MSINMNMGMGQSTIILVPGKETDRVKIFALPDSLKLHFGFRTIKGSFETTHFETLPYTDYPEFEYIVEGMGDSAAWDPLLLSAVREMCWDGGIDGVTAKGRTLLKEFEIVGSIGRAIAENVFVPAACDGKPAIRVGDATQTTPQFQTLITDAIDAGLMRWNEDNKVYVLTFDDDDTQPNAAVDPEAVV